MLDLRKKMGASLINVLVFFMMAMMVAAQIFFFSASSMETTTAQTEAVSRRFAYERYLYEALETVRTKNVQLNDASSQLVSYASGNDLYDSARNKTKAFFEQRNNSSFSRTGNNVCYEIYDLNYTLVHAYRTSGESLDKIFDAQLENSWTEQIGDRAGSRFFDKLNQMIFPSMGANYYLIRVYEKYTDNEPDRIKLRNQRLMYQVVVKKDGINTPSVISFQEVWY